MAARSAPLQGELSVIYVTAARQLRGSYHISQQNTFTGRLIESMVDIVLRACRHEPEA